MATVKFNSPEEFLEELGKDKEQVERKIVRLTHLFEPTKLNLNIRHLSVVATARVAGEVYRLQRYCGDLWEVGEQDEPVQAKAAAAVKLIEEGCAKLGLEVRTGIIE